MKDWLVYLLKCADDSLYCGVTKNIETRLAKHNNGTASKYTRSRLPVELAAVRNNLTKKQAFQLEYQIKRLRSENKISILKNGDLIK
jgi:putative endonuclease